jgi:phage/plasmid-associated DNA primase
VGKSVDWEDVANAVGDAAVKSRIDLCLAAATLETQTPAAASDPDRHPGPDHGARPRSAAGIAPERDDRFGPMHAEFDRDDPDHWAEAQRIGTLPTYTRRKKRDESGYVREPYAPVMPANDLARAHEYLLACHAPATINHAFGGGLSICVLNGERIYRHNGRRWVEQGDSPVSFLCGDIRRYFHAHCVAKQTREKPPGVNFVDANLSQNAVASIAKAVIDEINIITPRDEFQAQFLIRPNLRLDADGRPEIVADHAAHDRRLENRHAIGMPAPEDILPIRNGLLDLRCFRLDTQLVLLPHTPLFFNLGCSEIELDVEAANDALMDGETGGVEALRAYAWTLCREYHAFLSRTFKHSDDRCAPTTIRELHKVLGAVLAKSMGRYQKGLAWFVGPPGNGKSLIQSIIEAVVGPTKCVSSTVSQLDSNFHLHSWIGKDLAFFPDLDVSGRADKKKIVELLKMITGNDAITVDRKHLSEIPSVRLGTPILISTNQVPGLPDPTLALIRRSLVFAMNNPVPEAERDHELGDRLRTPESLAGVLLLGLCGLRDLDTDRGFRQPQWSEGPLEDLRTQLSMYHEFIDTFIEIVTDKPEDHWLAIGDIHRALKLHFEAEGRTYVPASNQMMAELKNLLIQQGWVAPKKTSKNAANGYTGLRLTEHAKDVIRQGDTNSHGGSHVGSNAGGHDDHGFLPPV